MRYYKLIEDGYITRIGTGYDGAEITQQEYTDLQKHIAEKPTAESGFDHKLKDDLTWELYELPPVDDDAEISDSEALNIMLGGTTV